MNREHYLSKRLRSSFEFPDGQSAAEKKPEDAVVSNSQGGDGEVVQPEAEPDQGESTEQ